VLAEHHHKADSNMLSEAVVHKKVSVLSASSFCAQVFIHRIRKYLGAYLVLLEGTTDAIVFSAGAILRCC
jgi:acetate kinase